jgi:hypothetical protein
VTSPFNRRRHTHGLIVVAGAIALLAHGITGADPASVVREQKVVGINGAREIWRLEWNAAPVSVCGADEVATALSCPCSGFAYGEAGQLSLVRQRPGAAEERLELTSFFKSDAVPVAGGLAVLQRWRPIPASADDEDDDWHHASDLNFLQRVRARGAAPVMRTADYNHDGVASEFLLQVGTRPCGKHVMVLVGVSRLNQRLHVFASAEAPDTPLELGPRVWEAVHKNANPVRVVEWPCGSRADEVESTVAVAVRRGIFHVQRETRPCLPEEQEHER